MARAHHRVPLLLVPCAPLCSFLLFLAYTKIRTGVTTFQVQQETWGIETSLPWTTIAASLRYIQTHDDPIQVLNFALLTLFAGALLLGLRWLPFSYLLYMAPQLIMIAMKRQVTTPLTSTSRYVLVLFPAFIVLALLLRWRPLHYVWLLVSLVGLALLFILYINGGPFVA